MADYFVSESGKNNSSGTRPDSPWRSIQKGINALGAGDTLYIMAGSYNPGDDSESNGSYWRFNNKNGTSSSRITISNYRNDVVTMDGQASGVSTGYPKESMNANASGYNIPGTSTKYQYSSGALIKIDDCSYLTLKGLNVVDSLGVGIRMFGSVQFISTSASTYSKAKCHHIIIKSCKISGCRWYATHFKNVWHAQLIDNEITFNNWVKYAGSICAHNWCSYVFFDENIYHQNHGENIEFDSNQGYSNHLYVRNNVFFDFSKTAIYAHAADYVIIAGNFIYQTPQNENNPSDTRNFFCDVGIHVSARECQYIRPKAVQNILVAHNVVVNALNDGIKVSHQIPSPDRCGDNLTEYTMDTIYVTNNTVVNSGRANYVFSAARFMSCVFKNNIGYSSAASKQISTGGRGSSVSDVSSDYNFYSTAISNIAGLKGAHDTYGTDPELVGLVPPSKNAPSRTHANFWVNLTLRNGYDNATNFRLKSTSDCIDNGTTITAPASWNSDTYDDDMSDWVNKAFDFSGGYVNTNGVSAANHSRARSWDIGSDEYQTQFIEASFSASPKSGQSPLKVTFTDKSQSSSLITDRFWDFGDGVISSERNPTHEYKAGIYTVSLRVSGAAGSDIITKNDLIHSEAPPSSSVSRVTEGLQALYRFDEGEGDTIFDVSGVGTPLDLKIGNLSTVNWLDQGLAISDPTIIVSSGPAAKIIEACRETNAFTIEVWLKPNNLQQEGPARIVSLSNNLHSRNVTLGQGLWGTQPSDLFDLRLRTTERSANGMPSFSSPAGSAKEQKTHLVVTRNMAGRTHVFLNKVIMAETFIPGDFSTWNPRFPLLLANEASADQPWLGEMYLVALYERALGISEVETNYIAGTDLAPQPAAQSSVTTETFRRFVLTSNGNSLSSDGGRAAVAYGVQYPDMRCVLCANGMTTSMAVYSNISAIIRVYGKQGLKVKWLD